MLKTVFVVLKVGVRLTLYNKSDQTVQTHTHIRTRGYKTLFVLNSVEHEILNAHKNKISRNSACLGSNKPRMVFFPLINVKMPTIVGILTFISRKKIMSC